MKLRLAAVCATLFLGWLLTAVAGTPSPASGVRIETVPDAVAAPVNSGPTSSVRDSTSGSATSGAASSSDNASGTGTASSNASGSSASQENGSLEGSSRRSGGSNDVSPEIARAREKIIDTGDKPVDVDKTRKIESTDKTFAPRLLDTASDISAVGAQKAQSSGSSEGDSQSKAKPAASEDKGDSRPKN